MKEKKEKERKERKEGNLSVEIFHCCVLVTGIEANPNTETVAASTPTRLFGTGTHGIWLFISTTGVDGVQYGAIAAITSVRGRSRWILRVEFALLDWSCGSVPSPVRFVDGYRAVVTNERTDYPKRYSASDWLAAGVRVL